MKVQDVPIGRLKPSEYNPRRADKGKAIGTETP